MRSSRITTEKRHQAIVAASARLFRERGINGVSVPSLMDAVGMTHGGFYKHFASKDDLANVAMARAFEEISQKLNALPPSAGGDGPENWAGLVATYLSAGHRDAAGIGCAAAALAGDVARTDANSRLRTAFQAGLEDLLATIARHLAAGPRDEATLVALSTMVGALILARATEGPLSQALLDAARKHLTAGLEPDRASPQKIAVPVSFANG